MINLEKSGNVIKFTFTDNDHYLQNGVIEVPVNSLTLVTDGSDMFTFKKSATNDIFISGLYSEIGMPPAALEAFYKENMVGETGGGGVTSGDVQSMIDESISGKADTSAVTEAISAATDDMATETWVGEQGYITQDEVVVNQAFPSGWTTDGTMAELIEDINSDSNAVKGKSYLSTVSLSDLPANLRQGELKAEIMDDEEGLGKVIQFTLTSSDTPPYNWEYTSAYGETNDWRSYLTEHQSLSAYSTTNEMNAAISAATSGKADTSAVTESINAAVSGKQDTLIAGENISISGNVISAEAGTVPYEGYSVIESVDNPWQIENPETPFYTVGNRPNMCLQYQGSEEWSDFTCIMLDYSNHTYSFESPDAADYISVEWDDRLGQFKIDAIQPGHGITRVENEFGYAKEIIPSGTTNETFDTLTEHVLSADTELNNKFNNYYTKQETDNTYLNKSDNNFVTFTNDDYLKDNTYGYAGKFIRIQNGYENYILNNPTGSIYTNYQKGIQRESYARAIAFYLKNVKMGNNSLWGMDFASVLDGGLNNKAIFYTKPYNNNNVNYRLYFGVDNYTVTTGESSTSFDFYGKLYYDSGCTKEYKEHPNWYASGEFVDSGMTYGQFYADQLEIDGFFSTYDTNTQGVYYNEDGVSLKVDRFVYAHPSNYTCNIFCLVNQNGITGNYYTYSVSDNSIVSNQNRSYGTDNFWITKSVGIIDYSKLTPLTSLTSGDVQTQIDNSISGKADVSAVTSINDSLTAHTADTTIHVTPAQTSAWDAKQDTLSAGTGIDITDNVISATGGGGGKAISAGTNISVTTGETADTINCTLPISVDVNNYNFGANNTLTNVADAYIYGKSNDISRLDGTNNIGYNIIGRCNTVKGSELNIIGYSNSITHTNNSRSTIRSIIIGKSNISSGDGQYSNSDRIIIGNNNKISGAGSYNAAIGNDLICGSYYETALGRYNKSVTEDVTKTNFSGNTIFSVGNGTSNSRHNAFEIRQNGDIYITSGGTDIKLQDNLGGGGASYSAGTGIDITNDVISVSGVVETSAITTSITSSSTDSQVPSAKAVYDSLGNIETLLSQI